MPTPKILRPIYAKIEDLLREKDIISGKSGRHMKFPYTISAKIAQFPLFHYLKNNPFWMYWPLGFLGTLWVFTKIHFLANSEANKRSWKETQAKNAAKEHGH